MARRAHARDRTTCRTRNRGENRGRQAAGRGRDVQGHPKPLRRAATRARTGRAGDGGGADQAYPRRTNAGATGATRATYAGRACIAAAGRWRFASTGAAALGNGGSRRRTERPARGDDGGRAAATAVRTSLA